MAKPILARENALTMNGRSAVLGLLAMTWASVVPAFDMTLDSGGSTIHVYVEDDSFDLSHQSIASWIQRSSDVVSLYFGRFPVPEAYVAVSGRQGKGVMNGIALGTGTAVVNVKLGLDSDEGDLSDDWVLVHELIHLGFPKVHKRHHWAEEGLAVYVESVARVQAGDIDPGTLWRHFVDGMPQGLPRDGDKGLDYTPTWGRTYWGGALFYLMADIEIIRRSDGQKTLRDGLRAIVGEGHSIRDSLELLHIYRIADRKMGQPVLRETYERHADQPVGVDLDLLWRRLGVVRTGTGVRLEDDAEWSRIRERITDPAGSDSAQAGIPRNFEYKEMQIKW